MDICAHLNIRCMSTQQTKAAHIAVQSGTSGVAPRAFQGLMHIRGAGARQSNLTAQESSWPQ